MEVRTYIDSAGKSKDTSSIDARNLEVVEQPNGFITKRIVDVRLANLSQNSIYIVTRDRAKLTKSLFYGLQYQESQSVRLPNAEV